MLEANSLTYVGTKGTSGAMVKPYRRWAGVLLLSGVLGAGAVAKAASGQDDKARAEALLAELEGDAAHKALTADVVSRAHQALTQGKNLRASGDETHAKLADAAAREWAEVGRDLVKAAELERRAVEARRQADDAGAEVDRERALLDEGIAQNGRLRALVESAEREKKQEPEKTSASAARPAAKNGAANGGQKAAPATNAAPKSPAATPAAGARKP